MKKKYPASLQIEEAKYTLEEALDHNLRKKDGIKPVSKRVTRVRNNRKPGTSTDSTEES